MSNVVASPGYEWITEKNFTKDAHKFNSCHHELKKGEIWVGNTSGDKRWEKGVEIPSRYSTLKTVRLGEQAYCVHGSPLSRDYCRPLIIQEWEEKEYERLLRSHS
jgi:hypothetical protein